MLLVFFRISFGRLSNRKYCAEPGLGAGLGFGLGARLRPGVAAGVRQWSGVCVCAGRRYDIGALVLIMFSSLTNRVREGFFQARMLGEHQGTAVADRGQVTGYQLRSGALEARPDVGTGSAFSADVKPGRRLGQFLGRM